MNLETLKVRFTFQTPTLGSANANPQLHEEHLASKAPTPEKMKEEVEALPVEEALEKATTVFPQSEGHPFIWDYQVQGFFKSQFAVLIDIDEPAAKHLSKWSFKRAVDTMLFVADRRNFFTTAKGELLEAKDITTLTRPLRADTLRGPRICLATSQLLPEGTKLGFTLKWIVNGSAPTAKGRLRITKELIVAALDFGQMKGFSQWSGGGFGRFLWEEPKD
jgi:hypothetical protein